MESTNALAQESTALGRDWTRLFAHDLPAAILFGIVGIALLILAFKIFDKMLHQLDFQVELGEKRNYALAIVIAAFMISVTWIIHAAMSPG